MKKKDASWASTMRQGASGEERRTKATRRWWNMNKR